MELEFDSLENNMGKRAHQKFYFQTMRSWRINTLPDCMFC